MDPALNQNIPRKMPESGGKDLKSNPDVQENVNFAL